MSHNEKRKIGDETVIICPSNTLVVANASGYHSGLQGKIGEKRLSIHLCE